MTLNPVNRSAQAVASFWLNNGPGNAPTLKSLSGPRCRVMKVSQFTSPNYGKASIVIDIGTGFQDVTSETNMRQPTLDNYQPSYLSQMRGCWVAIAIPTSVGNNTDTITTGSDTFVQPIPNTPVDNIDDSAPTTYTTVFVGVVWNIQTRYGNFNQRIEIECVDIGGWMAMNSWIGLPTVVLTSPYNAALVGYNNLPDFNQKENNLSQPNKDITNPTGYSVDYQNGVYLHTIDTLGFNGYDPDTSLGASRAFWSNLDIGNTVFSYLNSYYETMWQGLGLTISLNDTTGNCNNIFDTISARGTFWEILKEAFNNKRSLELYWTYEGSPGNNLTATLNIGFVSESSIAGFTPIDQFNYTADDDYPVDYYATLPEIEQISSGEFYKVHVTTKPCSLIYTWPVADMVDGWSQTPPDVATIRAGGVNQKFYNRYVLQSHYLPQISQSGISVSPGWTAETWTPSNTPVGVQLNIDGSGNATLGTISISSDNEFVPYPKTVQISGKLPISWSNGNLVTNTEVPPLFFYVDTTTLPAYLNNLEDPDNNEDNIAPPGMMPTYTHDSLNFNANAVDFFAAYNGGTAGYFVTMEVLETPGLYYEAVNPNVQTNCGNTLNITHNITPCVLMSNTIVGISGSNGAAILATTASDGVATVINAFGGSDLQTIANDLRRIAEFWIKPKNKCTFSISFIDPNLDNLGSWMTEMDVPALMSTIDGQATFETLEVNSVLTGIEWNFENQTTTYYTDFKQVPGAG